MRSFHVSLALDNFEGKIQSDRASIGIDYTIVRLQQYVLRILGSH